MDSKVLMEEVKNHETVSADCPTAGDSLAFVLFCWDSSMGVGKQKNVLTVRTAELINAEQPCLLSRNLLKA